MNPQLNHILAQERIADLQRAAEHARVATEAGAGRRRGSRGLSRIARALRMPTAHPSPQAWPDQPPAHELLLPAVAPDHIGLLEESRARSGNPIG